MKTTAREKATLTRCSRVSDQEAVAPGSGRCDVTKAGFQSGVLVRDRQPLLRSG